METTLINVGKLRRRDDARKLAASSVRALAESMKEIGMINPLRVRRTTIFENGREAEGYEVIAGSHRLEASRDAGMNDLPCVIVDDDDLHAELAMIDENLCRADLTSAQAAFQTSRRKEIYEELHPETVNGATGGGHSQLRKNCEAAPRFTRNTADATGRHERTVQLDAARGKALGDDLRLIAGTSLDKGKELDALAKLPISERALLVARASRGEQVSARPPVSPAPVPRNEFESFQAWLTKLTKVFEAGSQEWREQAREHLYPDTPVMDRRFGS